MAHSGHSLNMKLFFRNLLSYSYSGHEALQSNVTSAQVLKILFTGSMLQAEGPRRGAQSGSEVLSDSIASRLFCHLPPNVSLACWAVVSASAAGLTACASQDNQHVCHGRLKDNSARACHPLTKKFARQGACSAWLCSGLSMPKPLPGIAKACRSGVFLHQSISCAFQKHEAIQTVSRMSLQALKMKVLNKPTMTRNSGSYEQLL